MPLSWVDTAIVLIYLCCIFCVGLYAWWDNRKCAVNKQADSYFLASRDVLWLSVCATLFSSNIGAEHFVGLAGTAANTGIAVGAFEWTAPYMLWMMAYFLSDFYIKSGVVTTPEYLELRFNRKVRIYNAIMTLFIYIFVVISTTLYAGAVILETTMGWNIWTSSICLIIATGIYVTLGGLKAVVWTENIQTCILLIGGMIVLSFSLIRVGGLDALNSHYKNTRNMHLFRPSNDKDWPWIGICFGIFCNSYYYWCGQHLIVQRILSAKSPLHAKVGSIGTSLLKILPVWIMVIPGMCAPVLFPKHFENGTSNEYDKAYPLLVTKILPKGLIGLVIASMLSALMSSLAAVYNSASAIIVNDIYNIMYPNNVNDQNSVKIGRFGALIFIAVSMLWLPNIQDDDSELFIYTQQVISYVNPPLSAVFLFGHFWNRANTYGAYSALFVGFIIGISRFIFGILLNNKYCHNVFCEMNYLYFSCCLFGISSFCMVFVSLLTNKPDKSKYDGLTYWSVRNKKKDNYCKHFDDGDGDNVNHLSFDDDDDENANNRTQSSRHSSSTQMGVFHGKPPLVPLIGIDDNDENGKCGKCTQCFWHFVRLEGDEGNSNWTRLAYILTLISFVVNIIMWVWFR